MSYFRVLKETNEGPKKKKGGGGRGGQKYYPLIGSFFSFKANTISCERAEHWDAREWRSTLDSTSDLKVSLGQDSSLSVPELPRLKRQDNDIDL